MIVSFLFRVRGWLLAASGGSTGLVPANYLQVQTDPDPWQKRRSPQLLYLNLNISPALCLLTIHIILTTGNFQVHQILIVCFTDSWPQRRSPQCLYLNLNISRSLAGEKVPPPRHLTWCHRGEGQWFRSSSTDRTHPVNAHGNVHNITQKTQDFFTSLIFLLLLYLIFFFFWVFF